MQGEVSTQSYKKRIATGTVTARSVDDTHAAETLTREKGDIMTDEMKQLKDRLSKSFKKLLDREFADTKPKKKNRASEPMNIDEFIDVCAKDSRRHIRIIGSYADQLKEMNLMNGEYTNRGEWGGFLKRNLKVAMLISPYKDSLISYAMVEIQKSLRKNGGYMDRFTLETVHKFLVK